MSGSTAPPGVLDARGLVCPAPVIALARQVADLTPGETIEVWTDDPAARHDIPAWCRMTGHHLEAQAELHDGHGASFVIRRAT